MTCATLTNWHHVLSPVLTRLLLVVPPPLFLSPPCSAARVFLRHFRFFAHFCLLCFKRLFCTFFSFRKFSDSSPFYPFWPSTWIPFGRFGGDGFPALRRCPCLALPFLTFGSFHLLLVLGYTIFGPWAVGQGLHFCCFCPFFLPTRLQPLAFPPRMWLPGFGGPASRLVFLSSLRGFFSMFSHPRSAPRVLLCFFHRSYFFNLLSVLGATGPPCRGPQSFFHLLRVLAAAPPCFLGFLCGLCPLCLPCTQVGARSPLFHLPCRLRFSCQGLATLPVSVWKALFASGPPGHLSAFCVFHIPCSTGCHRFSLFHLGRSFFFFTLTVASVVLPCPTALVLFFPTVDLRSEFFVPR